MRRFFAYGLTIALLAACSTQEKDFQTPVQEAVIYYASFEQPAEDGTRVYANEDLLLRWTADDRVSIFGMNTYNQQYKFLGETGDNSGGFSKVDVAEYVTGNPISHTVSVYPYQSSTKITEDEVLTVTLPAEQHYAENTFGLGANTMVSVAADNFLQYKNVCGYLMLKLYGEGVSVSSITLKGNNGEKLAGKATVTMPLDGTPTVEMASDASTEITLTCDTPVQLGATAEKSTQFWFVIPPVTFSKGFTISISCTDSRVFEKSTAKDLTLVRNLLSKMSPILIDNQSLPSNVIYYTSSDDKIINLFESSGFDVSVVSNVYADGLGVMTFDGEVTSIGYHAFYSNSRLTSIVLPNGVMSIGDGAFWECENLTSVTLPDCLTSIGGRAFCFCTSLTDIIIPTNVKEIGGEAFDNCSSLTSIALPEGLLYIDNQLFFGCRSLKDVYIPNSVTLIGKEAFYGCKSITTVSLPEQLRSIGNSSFSGCSNLEEIVIPDSVTKIETLAFYNCGSITSITVLPQTPPQGGSLMLDETNDSPIYVPSESVDTYKNTSFWIKYADRIQAIHPSIPVPEAVDLGLPSGLKWASFNLGASKPEEYGDYYAWGETEPYYSSQDPLTWKEGKEAGYGWPSYKWCMGDYNTMTKYCSNSDYGYNGFTDSKTVLDPEDDAANVNLGGKWRIPTDEEWKELIDNCTSIWTQENGIVGRKVTSNNNGNSIFLPAAGHWADTRLLRVGIIGSYWSSSLYTVDPNYAWCVRSYSDYFGRSKDLSRYFGYPVRPVCE